MLNLNNIKQLWKSLGYDFHYKKEYYFCVKQKDKTFFVSFITYKHIYTHEPTLLEQKLLDITLKSLCETQKLINKTLEETYETINKITTKR